MSTKTWRVRGAILLASAFAPLALAANAITVHHDPACGCCVEWINYLQARGYAVTAHENASMAAVKVKLGVPARAASCHTAVIEGYVIEGHVPVEDIQRLLAGRPDALGLAAPGMPMGSPGMEIGAPERYDVVLIHRDGSTQVFATHGPQA